MPENIPIGTLPDTSQSVGWLPAIHPVTKDQLSVIKEKMSVGFQWGSSLHPDKIDQSESVLVFSVLMLLLITFVVFRIVYSNRFSQLAETFISPRYMRQALREELSLTHPFTLVMLLQYAVCAGLLIYRFNIRIPAHVYPVDGIVQASIFSGIIFGLIIVRAILYRFIQFLIGEDGGLTENRYSMILFTEVTGILILPFTILAWFGPRDYIIPLIVFCGAIGLIIYIFRIIRGFLGGLNSGTAGVYIFLYFCALEILPLIVLVRYISDRYQG